MTKKQIIVWETLKIPFEIYTYGSFASGLNLPWSDIDLLLDIQTESEAPFLEHLETTFTADSAFIEVKYIKSASIPVLKLVTSMEFENSKVDITLKDVRHSGMNCVALIRHYIVIYPSLKPIALVLKQLLYVAKLNDPYQHGLSSYGLVLMIVSFLQWLTLNGCYDEMCSSLGKLLLEFLKHYGSYFDYINWKVSPSLPQDPLINPYPQVD